MTHFRQLEHNKNFLYKVQKIPLEPLLNAFHQLQFQENLMRDWEKSL